MQEFDTYRIPHNFISALIKNDRTGLEPIEQFFLDYFLDTLPAGAKKWDCGDNQEPYFSNWNHVTPNEAGNVLDVTLYMDYMTDEELEAFEATLEAIAA